MKVFIATTTITLTFLIIMATVQHNKIKELERQLTHVESIATWNEGKVLEHVDLIKECFGVDHRERIKGVHKARVN